MLAPGFVVEGNVMKERLSLWLAALLLIAGTGTAFAANTQMGLKALNNWKTADRCASEAQRAHPAFTAAENAKRDAALNRCLERHNLPARDPLSVPPSH
jgi:hypothetical protein